jgi:hypothetical protein
LSLTNLGWVQLLQLGEISSLTRDLLVPVLYAFYHD